MTKQEMDEMHPKMLTHAEFSQVVTKLCQAINKLSQVVRNTAETENPYIKTMLNDTAQLLAEIRSSVH